MKMLSFPRKSVIIFIFLTITLLLIEIGVVRNQSFSHHSDLISLGITFDISIILPILYYFMVVRQQKLSPFSVLLFFLAAVKITWLILPNVNRNLLGYLFKLPLLAEPIILIFTILKIKAIVGEWQRLDKIQPDFIQNLGASLAKIGFPLVISRIMAGEIATFRYGFFFWKGKSEVLPQQHAFTYHKKNAYVSILIALIMISVIETSVVHLLLIRHWPLTAWIILGLSIYALLFLVADMSAVLKRPIIVTDDEIILRIGMRYYARIKKSNISVIQKINNFDEKGKHILKANLINTPNLLMTLQEPIEAVTFYGMKRTVSKITLEVDEVNLFLKGVQ